MASPIDVRVELPIKARVEDIRAAMFDPRLDPQWMAAVTSVDSDADELTPGVRVRRTGRFLGRTLRWTTEVIEASATDLHLRIIDGPMCGEVFYQIGPAANGCLVSIRNTGEARGMAPRWLLRMMMRRSLTADLRRLKLLVESPR